MRYMYICMGVVRWDVCVLIYMYVASAVWRCGSLGIYVTEAVVVSVYIEAHVTVCLDA